ncbi:Peptide-N4-(N-acetyl-beta-glucosaminyl)asparagine amidase A [Pseudocercospora fuligena]|uniref:Peptide-N4-(N-acetyl-beta-glucosaminyl)asparagine amidase A n=1 Tax=Pseudocercospora fuligena TaxID=685502 RepID=A0A8H6R6C5_9PEZI|nr:Peptide-N4-(N-acetyl-beta-glucosaminyl)asparagine amidase A [Pseudocercospora fuligena]
MHQQDRAEIHSETNHVDEKRAASSLHSSSATTDSGDTVDLPQPTPLSAGLTRHHLFSLWSTRLIVLVFFLVALAGSFHPCIVQIFDGQLPASSSIRLATRQTTKALVEVLQVYTPVLTVASDSALEITDGSSNASVVIVEPVAPVCEQTLVVHSFGASYGKPYVGTYEPPPCSFNRVTWNLTVTSGPGRQFDRLGTVWFGDTELFRTSTAEPSKELGIEWTYLKDMTSFLTLFKTQQTIIFDLGNLINDVYTASFNVTLTAAYFTADDSVVPADLVVPISNRTGSQGQASIFQFPEDTASNTVMLPRNIKKAIFTIAATGQSLEEFWYGNALQSDIYTFNDTYGELPGFSPFREVQLFIDDQLAGVVWPFPIIFTGGVVPGLWRPVVGIDAFDLKEDEIDITPWLPLLCDGRPHSFGLAVSGLNDTSGGQAILSETTDQYWLLSGKIFIWLDEADHITSGSNIQINTPVPTLQVSSHVSQVSNGTNETLIYHVSARRELSISSTVKFSSGVKDTYWTQSLSYSNSNNYTGQGNISTTIQDTSGRDLSSNGYARTFDYPVSVLTVTGDLRGNLTIYGVVNRAKDVQICGQPAFPTGLEPFMAANSTGKHSGSSQGASLSTRQNGTAYYTSNSTQKTSYTFGTTEQSMSFSGTHVTFDTAQRSFPKITQANELFERYILAVNGTIIEDQETLIGKSIAHDHTWSEDGRGASLSGMPGRGACLSEMGKASEGCHGGKR